MGGQLGGTAATEVSCATIPRVRTPRAAAELKRTILPVPKNASAPTTQQLNAHASGGHPHRGEAVKVWGKLQRAHESPAQYMYRTRLAARSRMLTPCCGTSKRLCFRPDSLTKGIVPRKN